MFTVGWMDRDGCQAHRYITRTFRSGDNDMALFKDILLKKTVDKALNLFFSKAQLHVS